MHGTDAAEPMRERETRNASAGHNNFERHVSIFQVVYNVIGNNTNR
jgi:hypothetical protein